MLQSLEAYPFILVQDFLRYFIAASAAYLLFWVIWKKRWQHRIIQNKLPKWKKMSFEFRYSMSTVFIFSLNGIIIFSLIQAGYTTIYESIGDFGRGYFLFTILLMILIHDAYFYWTHRLMHHPRIFRHVHLVHHRSTNPTPWAAYSFHPFEAQIQAGVYYIFILTFPVHGLALFLFLLYMITRNVLGHLGIEFLPKWFINNRWLNWHTTTTHHDLHHKDFNNNYGLYFTWWDNWCKTTHKKYEEKFTEVTTRERRQWTGSRKQETGNRRQVAIKWSAVREFLGPLYPTQIWQRLFPDNS